MAFKFKILITKLSLAFGFILFSLNATAHEGHSHAEVEWPDFFISGVEEEISIHSNSDKQIILLANGELINTITVNGNSIARLKIDQSTDFQLYVGDDLVIRKLIPCIPSWLSILPPLLAILLALIFREVIVSLFLGIFLGTLIPAVYVGGFAGILPAFFRIVDFYLIEAMYDRGHLSVIVFSMLIGATVSLISKNGGMAGVVDRLSVYAKNRRSGQLVTWFLGILIFFDDYANTLIVGNTMRPVTDKLKISREKLSYIVDSTAAPIAAIAFVTTWIGAELGYIQDGLNAIGDLDKSVYQIFLNSLQFSFYPIFTLIFIFMLVWMKRDFGPMVKAEKSAIEGKEDHLLVNSTDNEMSDFEPNEGVKTRSFNAVIPVLTIIFVTIGALIHTGWSDSVWQDGNKGFMMKISDTIGRADPYVALLWSSISGLCIAAILTLSQKILSIAETVNSIIKGFKTMLTAMIILILAWALSAVTVDLHTADFLTESISGNLSPYALPLTTFILAALVSFSTGSSWGTMAILYPMMMPLSWTISMEAGFDSAESLSIFYNVVSCVLAGSALGDHCSPISDTTILSSLASSCNHIEHVRTQLPYAISVGLVSIILGTIPASFGLPFYASFIFGLIAMFLIIKRFGKET